MDVANPQTVEPRSSVVPAAADAATDRRRLAAAAVDVPALATANPLAPTATALRRPFRWRATGRGGLDQRPPSAATATPCRITADGGGPKTCLFPPALFDLTNPGCGQAVRPGADRAGLECGPARPSGASARIATAKTGARAGSAEPSTPASGPRRRWPYWRLSCPVKPAGGKAAAHQHRHPF